MIGKILVLVLRFGFVIFRDRNLRNLQLLQASNLRVSISICLIAMFGNTQVNRTSGLTVTGKQPNTNNITAIFVYNLLLILLLIIFWEGVQHNILKAGEGRGGGGAGGKIPGAWKSR